MELTLTQAILFYYGQIKFNPKKMQEFQSRFVPLLLDGMSTRNRPAYDLFCSRFNQMITIEKEKLHLNLTILDEKFKENTFYDQELYYSGSYDSYMFPKRYYRNPQIFIETHRNKNPDLNFRKTVFTILQDPIRRVFETALAWQILTNVSITENFFTKILKLNARYFDFLTICTNKIKNDQVIVTRRYLNAYKNLLAIDLSSKAEFPAYNTILIGRMLFEKHTTVAHEVYDILKITCQSSLELHDARMTLDRRKTIKAVALSWLLIRTILDLFNKTLYLKDAWDRYIDIPNLRGRVMIPPHFRGDRPISASDKAGSSPTPWLVQELGIVRGRTPTPQYQVTSVPGDRRGIPTYFTIPTAISQSDQQEKYTFEKALENCFVDLDSCWATFCREMKVHSAIGGTSGSFLYVLRVMVSLQGKNAYSTLFPGLDEETYATLDARPIFTESEFFLFVKILASLWVGVTGGHCFHEILFTLNMDPIYKKYEEIFGICSSCNLVTLLDPRFIKENLPRVLNQASDYATSRIFHGIQSNRSVLDR